MFVFFGPVAVAGTYWVQALAFSWGAVWAGCAIGALNTAVLVANNLRDLETDRAAEKRTLPVTFGRGVGRWEYGLALIAAMAAPPLGVAFLDWSPWTLLACLAAVPALRPLRLVVTRERAEDLVPALPATARVAGLYGALFALGVAWGG